MTELRLFNSLTRQLETFTPVHDGEARVYSCGPTVYNYQHIGNMRAYVFADTLGRVLSYKGYKLTHVINITDVGHLTSDADAGDDKMEKAAAAQGKSAWDIAAFYQADFEADLERLNIRKPAHPKATEYIDAMIEWGKSISDKHCYILDSGLYFDVSTVPEYGRLARAVTEDGEARIEEVDGKRNAADFAIWRKTPVGETRQMEWDSPWGKGAPGWHLECSVMSKALLGMPFDIHTGGIDHREIHHPNEIAQNQAHEGCADSGARIWMHNNFLIERSGKMSKSSGEFLRLQLLFDKGFHPLAYRLMCLQAHYRSELEFSWEGLQAAFVRLKRMVMGVSALKTRHADTQTRHAELVSASIVPNEPMVEADKWTLKQVQGDVAEVRGDVAGVRGDVAGVRGDLSSPIAATLKDFAAAIADDLNTAIAITALENIVGLKKVDVAQQLAAIAEMDAALGLNLLPLTRQDLRIRPKAAIITEAEIETALAARTEARAAKDFAKSDTIRDDLIAKGVEVMDGDPLGWDWKLDV
ncbi:MAG: cysteine--tRNA ligase [Sphingorhabdus sp.]|uniref:cysteine--tRNA ligase n=1 Tax=Sphingorhabdus sp. TaxID=1902408 RepID=UPI0025E17380|nr:cysteine--tRNA ligase [Sphingorhabdus sp.]MCO4092563.1 cysteine--tRNA ligase [Sphingorhabdus sp.]